VIRDLRQLTDTEFDVLVVGAGIYGATIAWEATQRGLGVALIDRGDFGGGTSLNSLKTVHGGLRSLQRGNLADMRQFIRERRAFLRIAPHLVEPLRFVIPTYPRLNRSRELMRIALAVNDLIARDRNEGLDPARRIGASGVIGRDEMLRLFPGLSAARVTGGAAWYEAQMYSPDRILLAFVQSAVAHGAAAANYVGVTGFLRRADGVIGASVCDELTGNAFDIRARVTINATGGWAPALMSSVLGSRLPAQVQLSKALNLVTRLPAPACAIGDTADGQFLFCVPWRGVAVFGTFHSSHTGSADDLTARESDAITFLGLVNRVFPDARVRLEDVTLVHRGLLPATGVGENGRVHLTKASYIRDHRADGLGGLITVVGVRFTTARATAERTVDAVGRALGRSLDASRTAVTPLVGGDIPDVGKFFADARFVGGSIKASTLERLARSYGTSYPRVISIIERDASLARPLSTTCAVTHAEVLHAVRDEMAVRLSDVLLRRTETGSAAHPGRDAVEASAAIMAAECGWDPSRTDAEIAAVEARYRVIDD
jgi:glycerol-3-phosphate dehydrogenase